MKTKNIISRNISKDDLDLFFGPIDENDTFIIVEDHWTMAHVMNEIGLFPSVSQARKNGWNKPIPEGFTMLTVGKKAKKQHLFIFVLDK